ncbi:hypothetical protein PUN28_011973 [Cardiocondyla obscurior]|uniref:Uncharacterized protein n=1 Tax=Cardiocondyla obscurior TaxID=286306 RepID=A0AAW2F9Y4_9HYME
MIFDNFTHIKIFLFYCKVIKRMYSFNLLEYIRFEESHYRIEEKNWMFLKRGRNVFRLRIRHQLVGDSRDFKMSHIQLIKRKTTAFTLINQDIRNGTFSAKYESAGSLSRDVKYSRRIG